MNEEVINEEVIFVAKGCNRYSLHVKPEHKAFGQDHNVVTFPAKIISFEGGVFKTENPEKIEAIRATKAFKKGRVFELPKGAAEPKPERTKTHSGAISTKTLKEEAGVEENEQRLKLQESGLSVCDICDPPAEFPGDFTGQKLRMHKIHAHGIGKMEVNK